MNETLTPDEALRRLLIHPRVAGQYSMGTALLRDGLEDDETKPFCDLYESAKQALEAHEEKQFDGPAAERVLPWLRDNLGEYALAPLTGTDTCALRAAVQVMELYQRVRMDRKAVAFMAAFEGAEEAEKKMVQSKYVCSALKSCIMEMQPKCREFAYHAIAMVGNWSDRALWWEEMALPVPVRPIRCKHEPKGGAK